MPTLYRRRLIPEECVSLDKDIIVVQNENQLITIWNTLRPKAQFSKGISYYVLDKGWKISKLFNEEGDLVYIYCDIIETVYEKSTDTYIFIDLLADVIIENDGFVRVVDLDELSLALSSNIINNEIIATALNRLNDLLSTIYSEGLTKYTTLIDEYFYMLN